MKRNNTPSVSLEKKRRTAKTSPSLASLKKENKILKKQLDIYKQLYESYRKIIELHNSSVKEFYIPKKIRILGEQYEIIIDSDLPARKNKMTLGTISFEKKEIRLKSHKDLLRTLIHEISHLQNRMFNLSEDEELYCNLNSIFWEDIFMQIVPKPKILLK